MPNSFTPQQIEQFLQEFFDVVGARQYIGARYVPIFGRAGEDTVEWDDGAPYEPLTVVMHLGVSYVSRRYVPQGIQITDTDYWVETYRFNAQVEQYRQEVLTFQGQIDQVREDYVPFPDPIIYPKYGTLGQVLTTLADGGVRWDDPVTVTPEVAEPLIESWLDEHPEATTTVLDNSITDAKLVQTGGILDNINTGIRSTALSVAGGQAMAIEQSGFTPAGLNDGGGEPSRCRTRGHMPVLEGHYYRVGGRVVGKTLRIGASFYADDQMTTTRLGYVDFANETLTFKVPEGAHFIRLLFGLTDGTAIHPDDIIGLNVVNLDLITTVPVSGPTTDIDELVTTGLYNIVGNFTGQPISDDNTKLLECFQYSTGPTMQRLTYLIGTYSGMTFVRFRGTNNVWGSWQRTSAQTYTTVISSGSDLNDYDKTGLYNVIGNVSNQAVDGNTNTRVLEVIEYPNAATFQRLTHVDTTKAEYGMSFVRFRNASNVWGPWVQTTDWQVYTASQADLDTYLTEGWYLIPGYWGVPNHPISRGQATILHVQRATNGPTTQYIYDPLNTGSTFMRFYGVNNVWTNWKGLLGAVSYTSPVIASTPLTEVVFRAVQDKVLQDIAMYGDHRFDMYEDEMYVDGSATPVPITTGHGNTCQFGTTLHGDFPYLYVGSWTQNTCSVYVNEVTLTTATLVRTITYPTLSGYLNCCVDEDNDRIYIVLCTSSPQDGICDFVVSDLNGTIISQTTLPFRLRIVQGMKFHEGHVYVTGGDFSDAYPDYIVTLDTTGQLVAKTDFVEIYSEFEGIEFNKGHMWLAGQKIMYKVGK